MSSSRSEGSRSPGSSQKGMFWSSSTTWVGAFVTRLVIFSMYVVKSHLSLGAKGVEVKILPAQENFTDPLKVPSDFLLRPKPLPSGINQVRVPTSSCCPSHPLSHLPAKYQEMSTTLDHFHPPAPARRQSWIVEEWDLVPLVTVVSPWRPEVGRFACTKKAHYCNIRPTDTALCHPIFFTVYIKFFQTHWTSHHLASNSSPISSRHETAILHASLHDQY